MIAAWDRAWLRLRNDYELAILSSFGACALHWHLSLRVVPFRHRQLARRHRGPGHRRLHRPGGSARLAGRQPPRRASLLLAVINTVGCLASAYVLGPPGLFWMYPALLGNFLLLSRRNAVLVTAIALTLLTLQGKAYESTAQLIMFLVSASVSGLVAFVFASRTETQRLELEALATLDSLTGVPNRRAMEAELANAVEQHRSGNGHFGLAMLDLDHFKRINDEHGHEAGDEVLIAFAGLVRRCIRGSDRCFRFGGEEFVLLLPGIGRGPRCTKSTSPCGVGSRPSSVAMASPSRSPSAPPCFATTRTGRPGLRAPMRRFTRPRTKAAIARSSTTPPEASLRSS